MHVSFDAQLLNVNSKNPSLNCLTEKFACKIEMSLCDLVLMSADAHGIYMDFKMNKSMKCSTPSDDPIQATLLLPFALLYFYRDDLLLYVIRGICQMRQRREPSSRHTHALECHACKVCLNPNEKQLMCLFYEWMSVASSNSTCNNSKLKKCVI